MSSSDRRMLRATAAEVCIVPRGGRKADRERARAGADRVAGTRPSHALQDYAADYEQPAYGTFTRKLTTPDPATLSRLAGTYRTPDGFPVPVVLKENESLYLAVAGQPEEQPPDRHLLSLHSFAHHFGLCYTGGREGKRCDTQSPY